MLIFVKYRQIVQDSVLHNRQQPLSLTIESTREAVAAERERKKREKTSALSNPQHIDERCGIDLQRTAGGQRAVQ